jgi:DNA-binding transcriptional LysR family regulator
LELRGRVGELVKEAQAVLRPQDRLDLAALDRTFAVRSSEGFAENFGPALVAKAAADAPGVRLRFVPKLDKDSRLLREGAVDLETGVLDAATGPEIRTQGLFRDRWIGVVRRGHPLSRGRVTPARYAQARHVIVSRSEEKGPVDRALADYGLERRAAAGVAGFSTALALARTSDLVATVPELHTGCLRAGLVSFPLPFSTPPFTVSMLWHPRMDADPAHRWLRGCVRQVCSASPRLDSRRGKG